MQAKQYAALFTLRVIRLLHQYSIGCVRRTHHHIIADVLNTCTEPAKVPKARRYLQRR